MPKKRRVTSGERAAVDPDDAPMLTAAQMEDMEHFRGNTFIKRGPGRPPTGEAKELVSVRLDRDVVAKLRESGPGWQSQVSELLRQALRMRDVAVEGVFDTVAETLQGKAQSAQDAMTQAAPGGVLTRLREYARDAMTQAPGVLMYYDNLSSVRSQARARVAFRRLDELGERIEEEAVERELHREEEAAENNRRR